MERRMLWAVLLKTEARNYQTLEAKEGCVGSKPGS